MLSPSHLIIVFLVALLVFGPEKLPELARTLSKAMGEFHRLTGDFQETLQREMRQLEHDTTDPGHGHADDSYDETPSSALPGGEVPPETGEAFVGPATAEANSFEGLRYGDASYVAAVAETRDEKWAGESSGEAAPETPPDDDTPPDAGNSSSEDKPSVAGGAENPVNDHPTAA